MERSLGQPRRAGTGDLQGGVPQGADPRVQVRQTLGRLVYRRQSAPPVGLPPVGEEVVDGVVHDARLHVLLVDPLAVRLLPVLLHVLCLRGQQGKVGEGALHPLSSISVWLPAGVCARLSAPRSGWCRACSTLRR